MTVPTKDRAAEQIHVAGVSKWSTIYEAYLSYSSVNGTMSTLSMPFKGLGSENTARVSNNSIRLYVMRVVIQQSKGDESNILQTVCIIGRRYT